MKNSGDEKLWTTCIKRRRICTLYCRFALSDDTLSATIQHKTITFCIKRHFKRSCSHSPAITTVYRLTRKSIVESRILKDIDRWSDCSEYIVQGGRLQTLREKRSPRLIYLHQLIFQENDHSPPRKISPKLRRRIQFYKTNIAHIFAFTKARILWDGFKAYDTIKEVFNNMF